MKTVRIPAKQAIAFEVSAGTEFDVMNPEGTQVADLTAVTQNGGVAFSQAHTRDLVGKIRTTVGDTLYARDGTSILSITDDDCGVHDILFAPCTGWLLTPPKFSREPSGCHEHLEAALESTGAVVPDEITTVNLFQQVEMTDESHLEVQPSPARPGHKVRFRADTDAIVAVSACAALDPHSGINGETLTPIDVCIPDATSVHGPLPDTNS